MKRVFFNQRISMQKVLSAWFNGNTFQFNWTGFKEKNAIFIHLGRIGIVLACRFWNIPQEDEVLVPSYNCGAEVDPFIWAGIKPVLYRVDEKAKIDFDDIRKRTTSKTRILYVTHYFGWPQELDEVIAWCRERDIYLMEDCALSLFSEGINGPIGQRGDATIFSFRKTLPVPDGAALVFLNSGYEIDKAFTSPDFYPVFKETIRLVIRWGMNSMYNLPLFNSLSHADLKKPLSWSSENQDTAHKDMPSGNYFDGKIVNRSISRLSKGILNKVDPLKVVEQRRNNYMKLFLSIRELSGVQFLFDDLPEGVCPLLMPIIVSKPQVWINALKRQGIGANRWWAGYHRALNLEDFPEASRLKDSLLALPVHQDLREDDIEYISDCMHSIAKSLC